MKETPVANAFRQTVLMTAAMLLVVTHGFSAGAAMVKVPVLTAPVAAGERIDTTQVEMRDVAANTVFAGTVKTTEALLGTQAARYLEAGKPLNRLHVKPAMDVQQNSLVTVLYRAPGMELSGSGQALEGGRIGETVKVLNVTSRATLVAVVTDINTVEVK